MRRLWLWSIIACVVLTLGLIQSAGAEAPAGEEPRLQTYATGCNGQKDHIGHKKALPNPENESCTTICDDAEFWGLQPHVACHGVGKVLNADDASVLHEFTFDFTPDESHGTFTNSIDMPLPDAACSRAVVTYQLYQGDELVISHTDLNNIDQSVMIDSAVMTDAACEDGSRTVTLPDDPSGLVRFTDTVHYTTGAHTTMATADMYKLVPHIFNKATGQELDGPFVVSADNDGDVTLQETMEMRAINGVWTLPLAIRASALEGVDHIVIGIDFYNMWNNPDEIDFSHIDLDDPAETLHIRRKTQPILTYESNGEKRYDTAKFVNIYTPPRISTEASGAGLISPAARISIPTVIAELIEKVRGEAA